MPLLSFEVIRSTWNAIGSWTSAQADREAERFVERQPVVNAAVLALTEDAGEDAASMALFCASAVAGCYEAARGRALPRVREQVMDAALEGMERWGRHLENMDELLLARRALYGHDLDQPYLVAELVRYLTDASDRGEFASENLGTVFSVMLAVIRAFDRVSGPPRRAPSMEQVLKEMSGATSTYRDCFDDSPEGGGRRHRDCCRKKRSTPPTS
jgi:hypothetical protein